jgi:PAS domain S-box-containing protein
MQMAVVWTRPIESALACIEATIRSAKETGELVYSGYGLEHRLTNLIARGDPLDEMLQEAVAAVDFIRKIKFRHVIDVVLDIQAFIESLRGYATQIDEAALETRIVQVGVPFANCSHWILLLSRHFMFGEPETALAFAEKAKPLFWAVQCHIQSVDYRLYHSLAIAAVFLNTSRQRQSELRKTLAENLHLFQQWAESCPSTFLHKFALVAAETARLEGREMEAMRLYEQAIRSAADHGFVQYQGLANELAARFCLECGLPRVAHTYLRDARNCYLRWGALGKVAQLDKAHPGIGQQAPPALLTTIEAPVENLDLATVIRTSQAVASEVVPEKLVETLMMIAVEHAGADRGLLVLPREEEQWIEAEARTHLHTVRVRLIGKLVTTSVIPTSILHHVVRTQGTIILDDAAVQNPFSGDNYLAERRVRSLLCLPLVKQTALVGVLYLENNLASHVFTPARIAVLKLLSSQAAISLENARLYSALRVSEASLIEAQRISHTGSWRWRTATGEVSSSVELLRIYGFPPTMQPSQVTLLERVHADDRPWLEQILDRAVRDGQQFEHEYRIAMPDGSIKHLQAVGQPDATKSGEIEFVGTVMDITERRRAEEALKNAQMELARVARLTTLGELVASITHEINQPLAAVSINGGACLNFLNREKPDLDGARDATVAIVRDANRADGVIRGLRALAAKSEAQLTEFDINEAVREVLALTRSELQRHGVALHTDLFAHDQQIFGDRVQLQQVLLNLIMNGVEAMSAVTERPKVLTITSQTNDLDGVRVLVEDTGTGLDPATADHIFDPFFTTKPKGMGMGLSICRRLIEAHGGRLSASQRLPHGAIFQFTVRRAPCRQSVGSNVRS